MRPIKIFIPLAEGRGKKEYSGRLCPLSPMISGHAQRRFEADAKADLACIIQASFRSLLKVHYTPLC